MENPGPPARAPVRPLDALPLRSYLRLHLTLPLQQAMALALLSQFFGEIDIQLSGALVHARSHASPAHVLTKDI